MKALLWKELRLANDVVIGASVLLVAAFPLAAAAIYASGVSPFPWASVLGAGCVLNQYTMVLTGALLGATAFAREQEEGVVSFLAQLPLTIRRQYTTKILAGAGMWLALWAVNLAILLLYAPLLGQPLSALLPFLPNMATNVVLSFAAWGLATAMGCRMPSVTGAAFTALLALMMVVLARFAWVAQHEGLPFFSGPFLAAMGWLGVIALGAAYDLYRKAGSARQRAFDSGEQSSMPGRFSSPALALIWKDTHLMRPALILGGAMLAVPLLGGSAGAMMTEAPAESFRVASLLAIVLTWIVLPWWAANSLAAEWPAQTQAFLAVLPVSARRVIGTKLILAAIPSAVVCAVCAGVFFASMAALEDLAPAFATWDTFNQSGFLAGGMAYVSAIPVPFAVAWYFAARLRRKTVAMVMGVLAGPAAMAAWAVSSALGAQFSPAQTAALHIAGIAVASIALTTTGTRRAIRHGLV